MLDLLEINQNFSESHCFHKELQISPSFINDHGCRGITFKTRFCLQLPFSNKLPRPGDFIGNRLLRKTLSLGYENQHLKKIYIQEQI